MMQLTVVLILVLVCLLSLVPSDAVTFATYAVPEGAPRSDDFSVRVQGRACGVYANQHHAFTGFSFGDGPVTVEITCRFTVNAVVIRPLAAGITAMRQGNIITFTLKRPQKLSVEVNDDRYLFLFADALEQEVPKRGDANVIWYGPGYHNLAGKQIVLESHQWLYISGGAYLDNVGALLISNARDVRVSGRGVLGGPTRVFGSSSVDIEGIVIAPRARTWMNKIDVSQHVRYRSVKALAGDDSVVNYDGFDVMSGCHHITIDDVFVRATDDVLSIKHHPTSPVYWCSKAPISDITFSNAITWNHRGGGIIRIGPETIGSSIERVTIRNMEVIHHDSGAVFEIRTVDGVRISDIVYDGVRIESASRPIFQFDMGDWYKVGSQYGHVTNLYFRDIAVQGDAKQGMIRGANAQHGFADIYFNNVCWNGEVMKAGRQVVAGAGVTIGADARPVRDASPPQVLDATALITDPAEKSARVYVRFSEPVDRDTAEQPANYAISGEVRVLAAQLDHRFRQVILSTTGMAGTTPYTLTVGKVQNMAGTGSLPNTSRAITMQSAVKAVDSDLQGWRGWWREQYNPVAMHVYRNRPDIQYAPGYLLMNRYLTADGWAWFGHDADVSIRGRTICAGQRFWPVYTWMAPAEGTVRLTGTIRRAGESAASPRVRIVKNLDGTRLPKDDVTVWDWQAITETEIVHDVTTEVTAGSVVRFIVAGAGASVQWEPAVAYVTK